MRFAHTNSPGTCTRLAEVWYTLEHRQVSGVEWFSRLSSLWCWMVLGAKELGRAARKADQPGLQLGDGVP
jgi:hypothetical protein